MQVIKPFEINNSNMTSTIGEPSLDAGERNWIVNKSNKFSIEAGYTLRDICIIGDLVYCLEYNTTTFQSRVSSYTKLGDPVDFFNIPGDRREFATDGIDLYISTIVDGSTVDMDQYSTDGTLGTTVTLNFDPAKTHLWSNRCQQRNFQPGPCDRRTQTIISKT